MTKYNEQPAGMRIPSHLVADPDLERELRDRCWTSIVLGRPYADIWNDLSADLADLEPMPAQRRSRDRASGLSSMQSSDSPSRRGPALGPGGSDPSAAQGSDPSAALGSGPLDGPGSAVSQGRPSGELAPDVVAQKIVRGLFEARRAQQREFGPVKTNLSAAFATLNDYGVVARQNFMCCMSCGLDAISGEVESSAEWDGYAFYHAQDAERLVETGSTYVAFGVFLRRHLPIDEIKAMSPAERDAFADEKAEALARSVIVPTFEMYGIDVEWDGSAGSRMVLHGADYYVPLNEGGLKDECAVGG